MTTIVRHKRTGNEYILLGINGEQNKTNPSRFINELFNSSQPKSEVSCSATVCDVQGNLFLAYINDLIVIEIDGIKPADVLPEPEYRSTPSDSYRQPVNFDDEELEDEDFDDFEDEEPEQNRVIITPQPQSSPSQGEPNKSDFDDEDKDWI